MCYIPEFHPGPKGKSHAKTWRMMGDSVLASSYFTADNSWTAGQAAMSASYMCEAHNVVALEKNMKAAMVVRRQDSG